LGPVEDILQGGERIPNEKLLYAPKKRGYVGQAGHQIYAMRMEFPVKSDLKPAVFPSPPVEAGRGGIPLPHLRINFSAQRTAGR